MVRRVARYGRPYLARIIAMLGIIVITALLSLVPPLLVRDLIDRTLPQRDFARLNLLALGMIVTPLLNGLLGVGQRYLSVTIGEGVIYDLRVALYTHMQHMSLRFFTNTKTGELMSRLNNDVSGAQRAINGTIVDLLTNVITLVSTLALMMRLNVVLTILAAAVLPLFVFPARLLGNRLREMVRRQLSLNAEMNAMMNETLNVGGAMLAKLFGRGQSDIERFSERAASVRQAGIRQTYLLRWFTLTTGLVSAVGAALVLWVGGLLVLRGSFTAGTIVAFTAYLGMLYGPLTALTNARVDFATSLVSFERVFEVLDLPLEIKEHPGALRLKQTQGRVCFDDVSFSYRRSQDDLDAGATLSEVVRYGRGDEPQPPMTQEEREHPAHAGGGRQRNGQPGEPEHAQAWALHEVSFVIRPGELAALVGPSGAGKTTISYLLPRLYDPSQGSVRIDGIDIRDLTFDTLAEQIGMVTQETYLFNDTIRANLLYASPKASDEQLEAACRIANIHDFILSLPEGYETVVGNRGYRLSGGEKQRLAIARVVLRNPRILVLDEATSSLDSQSEALIQAALERIMVGRTSLVIAHRLSTILAANVILVLDQGHLVEQGTHAELLARGGLYAALYETQFHPGPMNAKV